MQCLLLDSDTNSLEKNVKNRWRWAWLDKKDNKGGPKRKSQNTSIEKYIFWQAWQSVEYAKNALRMQENASKFFKKIYGGHVSRPPLPQLVPYWFQYFNEKQLSTMVMLKGDLYDLGFCMCQFCILGYASRFRWYSAGIEQSYTVYLRN